METHCFHARLRTSFASLQDSLLLYGNHCCPLYQAAEKAQKLRVSPPEVLWMPLHSHHEFFAWALDGFDQSFLIPRHWYHTRCYCLYCLMVKRICFYLTGAT